MPASAYYTATFNVDDYLAMGPDLVSFWNGSAQTRSDFNNDIRAWALDHWQTMGHNEGRPTIAPAGVTVYRSDGKFDTIDFNASEYMALYPDIAAGAHGDPNWARWHWLNIGNPQEHRQGRTSVYQATATPTGGNPITAAAAKKSNKWLWVLLLGGAAWGIYAYSKRKSA